MDHAAMLAALLSARQTWVPLAGVGEVRIVRPAEAEFGKFTGGIKVEHVCEYVDGWRGFTGATLLGAAIGADDPVDFSPALWAAWVRDNVAHVQTVAAAISDAIGAHLKARQAATGN